jgi:catechol 2,3-dioxygenase-like lactoylglutathione lyase family enzyme
VRLPPATPSGRLHQHLTVSEMKLSIDYYTTVLGFRYDHGVPGMAWLELNGMVLTLTPGEPQPQPGQYFGWRVDSLDALEELYRKLRVKRTRLSAAPDAAPGRSYFFAYDPDGYPLCFSCLPLDNE